MGKFSYRCMNCVAIFCIYVAAGHSEQRSEANDPNSPFDLHSLMNERLPKYVVNCFLAAGFDTEQVICSMDITSDGPKNSIKIIESYIAKRFQGNPDMCDSFSSQLPFEFPPGHKLRICSFVQEVKQICQKTHKSKFRHKNKRLQLMGQDIQAKKLKTITVMPKDHEIQSEISVSTIEREVQSSIKRWKESQNNKLLRNLTEKEHYNVQITATAESDSFSGVVQCGLCNASVQLQQVSDKHNVIHYRISNWCRHMKKCVQVNQMTNCRQTELNFLPYRDSSSSPSRTSTSSSTPLPPSSDEICSLTSTKNSYSLLTDETSLLPCKTEKCSPLSVSDPPSPKYETCPLKAEILPTTHEASIDESHSPKIQDSYCDNKMTPSEPTSEFTAGLHSKSVVNPFTLSSNKQVFQKGPSAEVNGGACSSSSDNDLSNNWSRSARAKRQLLKAGKDPSQTHITDYFRILDNIEQLLDKNLKLSELLQQYNSEDKTATMSNHDSSFTSVLKQLLLNAEKNIERVPKHRRHSDILKKFATALLIYAGPLSYEFIHKNMPEALPSLRTVQRYIHSEYQILDEGSFRFDELLIHIKDHKASNAISIGEDATRVISRIDYDSETDRCVGFVLPIDDNGLPLVDSFLAVSYAAIEDMFKTASKAKYAYIYMAQTLCLGAPSFCLACMGSDNKFTAQHVMLRWKYIYEECRKRNILVLSYGGDGDSRIMKAMKVSVSLLTPSKEPLLQEIPSSVQFAKIPKAWNTWFRIYPRSIVSYVQDTVHVGVKLKSRLLKPSIVLPMGPNFVACGNHIQMIRMVFEKDQHNLRERDVNHKDKQNFDAVLHIISSAHLLKRIPEAYGTYCYVAVIQCVVDSYLDKSLSPLARLEKIWYANFFVRYWRQWILLSEQYTLQQNFITSNAYLCIELNAHALITFLLNVRDHVSHTNVAFLPWLLGSQTCERTFRCARSMSTVFSSVLNFGMLGLLRRLHRLHIQAVLQVDSEKSSIKFPRVEQNYAKDGKNPYIAPSLTDITNKDIADTVQKALEKAKATLSTLGMEKLLQKHSSWDSIKYEDCEVKDDSDSEEDEDDDIDSKDKEAVVSAVVQELCHDDPLQIENDIQLICKEGLADIRVSEKLHKLKKSITPIKLLSTTIPFYSFTEQQEESRQKTISPFIEVSTNNRTFLIRKTTAIWLLQEIERVSADRLFRVRNKQPFADSSKQPISITHMIPVVSSVLQVGNLCVFKVNTNWRVGRILQFAKYDTDSKKYSKPYNGHFVELSAKNIGVLCSWYDCIHGPAMVFQLSQNSDIAYKSLDSYICSIPENCIDCTSENTANECNSFSLDGSAISNTKQLSLLTRKFCIKNDYMPSLMSLIENSVKKSDHEQLSTGESNKGSDTDTTPIVIADNCEVSTDVIPKDYWTKCGGILLTKKELYSLSNDKELSDLHINAFQNLLKRQFPNIGGLQNTLLQYKSPITNKKEVTLQAINITISHKIKHWAAIELCGGDVFLYDSAYTAIVGDTKEIIAQLVKTKEESFKIHIMNTSKQSGTVDCGLYSIATMTSLALGKDPVGIVFQKEELRPYLRHIMESEKITEFPIVQKRKVKSRIVRTEVCAVYCLCRMPYSGSCMVCCDSCDNWFHIKCVDYSCNDAESWFCSTCTT